MSGAEHRSESGLIPVMYYQQVVASHHQNVGEGTSSRCFHWGRYVRRLVASFTKGRPLEWSGSRRAGHLCGRALQEWNVLEDEEKLMFNSAVRAMKDPDSRCPGFRI